MTNSYVQCLLACSLSSLSLLWQACEEALVSLVVTSNAAQMVAAAELYGCAQLLQTAQEISSAESSALGNCLSTKRRLQAERERLVVKQQAMTTQLQVVDRQLATVADRWEE